MTKGPPRHPNDIARAELLRTEAASAAEVQAIHLRYGFTPDERAIMVKALQAYAGMVPLEPATQRLAQGLAKKIEGNPDE